jgi:cyclophilin family peptidyl-prolyl cis-trans isomerase
MIQLYRLYRVCQLASCVALLFFSTGSTAAVPSNATVPAPTLAQPTSTIAAPAEITRTITLAGRSLAVSVDNPSNPLAWIATSMGDIVVELLPSEAPITVANFIALANGKKAFIDPATGSNAQRAFYNGLNFHRIHKNFMIQTGSADGAADYAPGFNIADEISALSLGLDKMLVVDSQGAPNPVLGIQSQADFQERVLKPLYNAMNLTDNDQLELRIAEVDQRVRAMTVQEYYELLGYRYQNALQSHATVRGMLAMANSGPNSNGSQFFITTVDAAWLTGKHTVFGKVRNGIEVVDRISNVPVDDQHQPLQAVSIRSIQIL